MTESSRIEMRFPARAKRRVTFATAAVGATAVLAGLVTPVLAQNVSRGKAADSSERVSVARGWALLANGDAVGAAKLAGTLLSRYPNSASVLVLAVDAEIDRIGAAGSLDVYERWLGHRTLEDPYALRRIAEALLRETARSSPDRALRLQAIDALTADGDRDALMFLSTSEPAVPAESAIRAASGNELAVNALIAQLNQPGPARRVAVAALGNSRSSRATEPLLGVLNDADPSIRAAAADALGAIGATTAIPQLKALLNDPVFGVHLAAAGALLSLKDDTGLTWLRQIQSSEHAGIRLAALGASRSQADSGWLAAVKSLTTDADPDHRRQAAELIAPHDPALARATLEPLLTDPNPAIRQAAADSYVKNVTTDFALLRKYLRDADSGTRLRAAERILVLTR